MKRLIAVLIFLLTIIQACKKVNANATPADVTGTWNWLSTSNDGPPGPMNPLTPANSGITQVLSFGNNKYVLTQNNTVVSSGAYSTAIIKNPFGSYVNQISYVTPSYPPDSITYYQIFQDTLYFSYTLDGSVGASANYYIRKQ
jgi:hypothetical protein